MMILIGIFLSIILIVSLYMAIKSTIEMVRLDFNNSKCQDCKYNQIYRLDEIAKCQSCRYFYGSREYYHLRCIKESRKLNETSNFKSERKWIKWIKQKLKINELK